MTPHRAFRTLCCASIGLAGACILSSCVFVRGFFTFDAADETNSFAKVLIHPTTGMTVGLHGNQALVQRFKMLERDDIHRNHALVEAYLHVQKPSGFNVLELEQHSAYRTLQPGESMSTSQT